MCCCAYTLLCIFSTLLVQHVLVTKHLMKFGMEQNLIFHTFEFLVVLHMCSSTNKCIPSWMLRAPSLCLLNTLLPVNVIDFGNQIQYKKVKKIIDVIFDETFTYNNFLLIPTHFIELFINGNRTSFDTHTSSTTSYSRSNGSIDSGRNATFNNRNKTTSYCRSITTSYCGNNYTTSCIVKWNATNCKRT